MKPVIILVVLLLTAAALVIALRPPTPLAPATTLAFLSQMDTDGSGTVSPEEYRRISDQVVDFSIFDADDSGALDTWEVEQMLFRISPDVPQPALLPRVW